MSDLTQSRLKELLIYDQKSGIFTNLVDRGRGKAAPAGSIQAKGYIRIRIDGKRYLAHRLAWFYVHGSWPEGQIDHKLTTAAGNGIANLRDVNNQTNKQNMRSARSDNKLGILGVYPHNGKYRAKISVNGNSFHLGQFDTPEKASEAYQAAKRVHHPGYIPDA